MSGICDTCSLSEECRKPIGGVDSCRRYVRAKESNYEKLFGSPKRAAKTLSIMQRCELGIIRNCDECEMHDACRVRDGDYDALLGWLRGDAE